MQRFVVSRGMNHDGFGNVKTAESLSHDFGCWIHLWALTREKRENRCNSFHIFLSPRGLKFPDPVSKLHCLLRRIKKKWPQEFVTFPQVNNNNKVCEGIGYW